VRFQILGPLGVSDGNGRVELGAGKHRALLALLLLHANEAVSVDRLVDELWTDAPPPTAAKIVQNQVSRLRKSLDGDVLLTRARGYELSVAEGELDADEFEQMLDAGRQALARGDPRLAAQTLREALALWRGPPLAEFSFEPFAQAEIARLEERRLTAIEERVDADLALGRQADVVAEIETLVAAHPLRERLRAALMLALYRSGRQAEALQVYQDTRRALVDELGVEPGPALQQLQRAILEHDPALGVSHSPPAAAPRVPRRGLRPLLWAGLVAVVLGAGVVVAVDRLGEKDANSEIQAAGNSLAVVDPATNRIVADVTVGRTPGAVAVGEGAAWILNVDDQTITRVDSKTHAAETFATGSSPTALAVGPGVLWAATAGAGRKAQSYDAPQTEVDRVDPRSTTVAARIQLPPQVSSGVDVPPTGVVTGAGSVWTVGGDGGVVRIDPQTDLVSTRVQRLKAKAIAYGEGALWALTRDSEIARVDPGRSRVTETIEIAATGLDAIAAGRGAVWAADAADGTLWRVDTSGGRAVSRTIELGQGVNGVAVGSNSVWAINGLRGTLMRIDPRANRVTATLAVGNTPSGVAAGAGRVWVAVRGPGRGVVPAAAAPRAPAHVAPLPAAACGRLVAGGEPQVLIASDFPLQGVAWHRALAGAAEFVLRRHRFRAGRFDVGYQACDDSTPTSGGSDPGKCTANAKLLAANTDVVGVVGPLESSCAGIEIPVLNRAPRGPLALISPANSQVALTRPDRFAFPPGAPATLYPTGVRSYARVYPRDDVQAAAHALLARQLGLRRLFVLDDREPYGQGMASHLSATARRIGVRIAGTASWDPAGGGLPELASRIERARADSVFLGGVLTSSGGDLVRALRSRLGAHVTLLAPDAFAPVWELWDQAGRAAHGIYITAGGVPNGRLPARGRRFVEQFGGTQPRGTVGTFAVSTAAATEALLAAIAHSDGTRASVARQLLHTKVANGLLGRVAFDRFGDITRPAVTVLRVEGRVGASDVENYEGAAVDRVIHPLGRN
jgi:DNA-binding SARP family transcriptional activator/ABC-type branched-subunit amino acid transport system substrate-binding protein